MGTVFVHSRCLFSELDLSFEKMEEGWDKLDWWIQSSCFLIYNFRSNCFMPLRFWASLEINNKMWILLVDINWAFFSILEQNCWCWKKKKSFPLSGTNCTNLLERNHLETHHKAASAVITQEPASITLPEAQRCAPYTGISAIPICLNMWSAHTEGLPLAYPVAKSNWLCYKK